jgi:DNA polymerase-3 subunit gamma/tau
MAILVLYRRYRPQTFKEFIGQENMVKTLTNALAQDMISHAYLFSGPRGSGKTSLARLLAKAVNCEQRKKGQFEPCNKCSSCLEIAQGQAMDLIEIDAASHRGIDEMRSLREGIRFVPSKSKYKVFVIDESHQLTKEASNALLKTLEEPPSHAIFVLATTEIHKMIPTIVSRCQRFNFRKLKVEEILKKLEIICQKEGVKPEKAALTLIAQSAQGSLRDAESLLDQVFTFSGKKQISIDEVRTILGLVETEVVGNLLDLLLKKDAKKSLEFLNETLEQGLDPQELVKALINYLRLGLILKIAGSKNTMLDQLNEQEIKKLESQVKSLEESKISQILELFLETGNKIKYSTIPQLPIELAIIEACELI